ncbi:MAG: glycosyltransferase family 4 protein [Bacteroidales bacterium]|nr:glycosyltransferase family 4 protein [Bacteroidales bacterium]
MKILVVHNDYGKYSGEEAVVDSMIAEGRKAGHEIETLRRTSKGSRDRFFGKVHGFMAGIFSLSGRRMMRKALRDFKPDIVHIHNLYPFISPAVLPICRKNGVPVVMTVHNYRLICPTGLFLRDGKPCENCLKNGNEWDCIRYNCEHSRFRSLGYALRNAVARWTRTYKDCVDLFCCLTTFQKEKLVAAGFDEEKITVIPNSVDYIEPQSEPLPECETDYVGYVGRLSEEKGYNLLLEVAQRHPEIIFRFAGTPRDDKQIEVPTNVRLCGQLTSKQLARFYTNARFIVIPSRCYEGFPVALLEAASHNKCCIAPNHGAFPDLMKDKATENICGLLFNPLEINDLEKKVVQLWNDKKLTDHLGQQAEDNYQRRFLKNQVNKNWDNILNQITIKKQIISRL